MPYNLIDCVAGRNFMPVENREFCNDISFEAFALRFTLFTLFRKIGGKRMYCKWLEKTLPVLQHLITIMPRMKWSGVVRLRVRFKSANRMLHFWPRFFQVLKWAQKHLFHSFACIYKCNCYCWVLPFLSNLLYIYRHQRRWLIRLWE